MKTKILLISILLFILCSVKAEDAEKTLAIFNFTDRYELFREKPVILTLLIFSKITDKTNKIQILERQELDSLGDEQIITVKNSVKPVRENKFAGSEYILKGKIYSLGDKSQSMQN